jgi:PAS domain S-box-containing protein
VNTLADNKRKILIIDDELAPRESLRMILKDRYTVKTSSGAEEGLKILSNEEFDVVILDIRMTGMDGITALKEIKRLYAKTEVIMVTAYASVQTARSAIQLGAIDYLMKPFDKDDVLNVVEKAIARRERRRERIEEHVRLKELVDERTKELKITEKILTELFENANDGIILMDTAGRILDLNQKACKIHGYSKEELKGKNIEILESTKNTRLWKKRMELLLKGEPLVFETEHLRKDGGRIFLEVSSKAIEAEGNLIIQSFQRDITEKRIFQKQLIQSQKLETIGRMISGIAHDFGNMLSTISSYARMLSMDNGLPGDALHKVKIIDYATTRANNLINQLLNISRKDTPVLQPVYINSLIEDTVGLLDRTFDEGIEIKMQLSDNIPLIRCDSNQIEQVLMNLIMNAKDAITPPGEITIKTSVISFQDESNLFLPLSASEDYYLLIEISDTGKGIPEKDLNKIFDPFFTTKEEGKGTGLGLSVVWRIISSHHGYINVKSRVEKGTVFSVYLPVNT